LLNAVSTLLRDIDDIEYSSTQMSQSSNGLHLDGVAVFERMIENSGSIDDLPREIVVEGMTDKERFGSEGIGLHIDFSTRDLVHEAALTDVGVATQDDGARVGIDRRKARQMLAHFFKIGQRGALAFDQCTHATQSSSLELLATVERVAVLEQTSIVFTESIDQVAAGVEMAESELVVVAIIENVDQIGIERVDIL
jgi:hypothetical protein